MHHLAPSPFLILVCGFEVTPSGLVAGVQFFSVKPFCRPNPLLAYARAQRPDAEIIRFGESSTDAGRLANRLREVSESTLVIITLKVRRPGAQGVLLGNELVDLINKPTRSHEHFENSQQPSFKSRRADLGCCA
jgi:hypothetical protein